MTGHYLNPVVPENYTNNGTTGSFSLSYERDLTPKDRLTLIVRHELARYQIPNELVQQNGAYLPNADNTAGCPPAPPESRAIACLFPEGSCRPATTLKPWGAFPTSTSFPPTRSARCAEWPAITPPIFIPTRRPGPSLHTQHNDFKEIYFNGSVSIHHGRQELKAGVESDAIFLHENISYVIPDCAGPTRSPMSYQSGDLGCRRDNLCLYRQPAGS